MSALIGLMQAQDRQAAAGAMAGMVAPGADGDAGRWQGRGLMLPAPCRSAPRPPDRRPDAGAGLAGAKPLAGVAPRRLR